MPEIILQYILDPSFSTGAQFNFNAILLIGYVLHFASYTKCVHTKRPISFNVAIIKLYFPERFLFWNFGCGGTGIFVSVTSVICF